MKGGLIMKLNKKHLASIFVAGALVVSGAVFTASAASASNQTQDQATITVEEVQTIVQEAYPDYTIGEIELENDHGTPVYDVEVADKDGIPYDVEVDPDDGTILQIQLDDDYAATGVLSEDEEND